MFNFQHLCVLYEPELRLVQREHWYTHAEKENRIYVNLIDWNRGGKGAALVYMRSVQLRLRQISIDKPMHKVQNLHQKHMVMKLLLSNKNQLKQRPIPSIISYMTTILSLLC